MLTRKRLLRVGFALLVIIAAAFAVAACGDDKSSTDTSAGTAAAPAAASGDAIALRYTYNVGDSWGHEIVTLTKATAQGMGESGDVAPTEQTTKVLVTTTVKEVVDGVATLSMLYQTLESTVDGQAETLDGSATQEISMKVDQTGKVVQDDTTSTSTGMGAEALFTGQMFDPTDFNNQFSILYPEAGQAKVGEAWTRSSTVPVPSLGQEITVTTKATLTAVGTENGRETASIDYETSIPLDMSIDLGAMFEGLMGGSTEAADMVFVMSIKGDLAYTGTAQVDRATGQTITSDSTATIDFEMNITDASEEMVPLDQRGPFTSNMDLTITVTEAEPGNAPVGTSTSTPPISSGTGETTVTSTASGSGAEEPGITQATDLSPTIVLPAGWAMADALTAADVEAVIGRTGYKSWPEPDSNAASGKPAGSYYDGSNIDTKIMFRAYTQGGAAEYERLAGFVIDPQEIAADLWDKLIVGTDKFATYPLTTALILRGDVCLSIQWRPEQYSDIDPLDLGVGLADMFVTKLFKAQ